MYQNNKYTWVDNSTHTKYTLIDYSSYNEEVYSRQDTCRSYTTTDEIIEINDISKAHITKMNNLIEIINFIKKIIKYNTITIDEIKKLENDIKILEDIFKKNVQYNSSNINIIIEKVITEWKMELLENNKVTVY